MIYPLKDKVTETQRCNQCKSSLFIGQQRYFCCDKRKFVCWKCSKNACNQCGKKRENKIMLVKCSHSKCRKIYDIDDMFYDFKGDYRICPKCLRKQYQFHYHQALKANKEPQEVQLLSKSVYPYKDLVNFFKNWCFSCANKIGDQDAYQMIRGPRICGNCIALNEQTISHMIRCISCEGYIHTVKEVYQNFGNQKEVICIYCAQKDKQQLKKASNTIEKKMKQPVISKVPSTKSSNIRSALKMFKFSSEENGQNGKQVKKIHPSASKISSVNSYECQQQDRPLKIKYEKTTQICFSCNSAFQQQDIYLIKKSDKDLASSILKLVDQNKGMIKLCPLCYSFEVKDHGKTVQFSAASTRNLKIEEQNKKQPAIVFLKPGFAKQGTGPTSFKHIY